MKKNIKIYIFNIVYPRSRSVILEADYLANVDFEVLLLRAAYDFGRDVALELAFAPPGCLNTEFHCRLKALQASMEVVLATMASFWRQGKDNDTTTVAE